MGLAVAGESFGSRVRRRRRETELTQRELAARVGIDFTYLSKLENDQEGQSAGEELVRRLALELDDNPEELLALAGKVPVDALRSRARHDAPFARLLRLLPGLEAAGSLMELVAPPLNMRPVRDAKIAVSLESPPKSRDRDDVLQQSGTGDLVTCHYDADFTVQQDEYLIGLVNKKTDRDRLRDDNAPIHDILVVEPDTISPTVSAKEVVRKYGITVSYRSHGNDSDFDPAQIEKLTDVSRLWKPQSAGDGFPIIVLRAIFPTDANQRERRMRLSYHFTLPKDQGFWFWSASRPIHVSTITVQAKDLTREHDCTFEKFLPNFNRRATVDNEQDGVYTVNVSNWVLKGHGVTLTWSPLLTRRLGGEAQQPAS